MKPIVGCVPYLNARPLVEWLDTSDEVEVVYDVPSKLPALLDEYRAHVVLASSIDVLRTDGRTFAEGLSISSNGPVESVKLLSNVPFERINSLALDASSLTSNGLALVLLAELFGVRPTTERRPSDAAEMLTEHDAGVLIGDKGMAASATYELDLGEAWTEHTGLPFVWALWIGGAGLDPELVRLLQRSAAWGREHLSEIAAERSHAMAIPVERVRNYLQNSIDFALSSRHLEGLVRYRDLLLKQGLLDRARFPTAVEPA